RLFIDAALLVGSVWTVQSLYKALRHAHGFCTARLYYNALELFMFGALSLLPTLAFCALVYLAAGWFIRRLDDRLASALAVAVAFVPACVLNLLPKNIFQAKVHMGPVLFWCVLATLGVGSLAYLLYSPRLKKVFEIMVIPALAALVAGLPFGLRASHDLYWLKKAGFSAERALAAGLHLLAFPVLFGVFFVWFLFRKDAARRLAWAFTVVSAAAVPLISVLYTGPPMKCTEEKASGRPNFVFIVVDALRADAIEPYGSSNATPNIAGFAAESVVFEDAQAVSPWTLSSMASFFTGLYPSAHRVNKVSSTLDRRFDTVYRRLKRAGYSTWAVIDQHFYASYRGISQGFDVYHLVRCHPCKVVGDHPLVARAFPREWTRVFPTCRHPTVRTALDAAAAIERSCKPFFGWVHFYDPHMAYSPPKAFIGDIPGIDERMGWGHKGWIKVTEARSRVELAKGEVFFDAKLAGRLRDLYLAEVRLVDRELARIFDALKRSNLWDNTVVILTADHGEELLDHGFFEHGHSVYGEVLHVPLIVRVPGLEPKRVSTRVRTIDVAPTILELAGIRFDPSEFQGRTLAPLLEGKDEPDREVLAESLLYYFERKALIEGRYKLVWIPYSDEYLLYDLEADPGERHPLAGDEGLVQRMKVRLNELLVQGARIYEKTTGKAPEDTYTPLTDEQIEALKALGYIE
ncbi:MAG TPA: hypothetical protein ENF73_03245, partial [Proteobacteria bacterium]|nr:hypothetical protein [Pseudomonadota bacterium]